MVGLWLELGQNRVKTAFFGRDLVKIKAKYRKRTTLFVRALVGVRSEIEKNTLFGRALVRVRAKIEKNTLFGIALVRVMAKIEKNTLFGTTLVRIKSEIEKNTFLVGLWLGLGQK